MTTPNATPVDAVKKGHRRQRSVGNTYQPLREGSLFEHFFYVGVPPQKYNESSNTVPQPEILFQYPDDNVVLPFEVISFCFPEGILQRGLRKTDSLSDVNRVLYGSLQVLEKSTNSFVFLVTKDTDVFYGVCVRNEELLENVSSFLKNKGGKRHIQIMEQESRSRSNSTSSPPVEPILDRSSEASQTASESETKPAPLIRSDSMIIHDDEEAIEEPIQNVPVLSVTSPEDDTKPKHPLSISDVYVERKSDETTRTPVQNKNSKPSNFSAAISAIKRSVSSPTLVNDAISPRGDNMKRPSLDKTNQMTAITERVYCFISRFPFFRLHYEVLYHLLARERLYMFEKMNEQHGNLKIPGVDESEFNSILKSYHSVPVPKPSEHVNFKLPGLVDSLTFNCPESNEDELITEWCLPSALRIVKLEHITTLIAAALTEHRIVIQCSTLGVLSSIVLGMIPLLRPYTWQGPLIPVLPSSLLEYLQAPVPYICGVLKLPTDLTTLDDTVIFKVDENEIVFPKDFEPLPKCKKLESDLKPFHTQLLNVIKAKYHDPYRNSGEQVEIVKKMINCIWEYHKFLLDTISPYLKPGMLEDTKKAAEVLDEIPRGFREFSHHLFNTQLFSVYFYELMTQVNEEQEAAKAHYGQLEDKIKTFEQDRKRALDQIALLQTEVRDYNDKIEALRTTQRSLSIIDNSSIKRKGPNPYSKFIQSSLESLKKSYWNVKTS